MSKQMIGTFSPMRKLRLLAATAVCGLAAFVLPAAASAEVKWSTETIFAPSPLQEGESGMVNTAVYNQGSSPASGVQQLTVQLPPGVNYNGKGAFELGDWFCNGVGTTTITCLSADNQGAFAGRTVALGFDVEPGVSGSFPYTVTMEGAGAAAANVESGTVVVDDERYGFGFVPGSLDIGVFDPGGNDYTTAGGHPYKGVASFDVNLGPPATEFLPPSHPGLPVPDGGIPKDLITELPRGIVGDPMATPRCRYEEFPNDCPPETQIGIVRTRWVSAGLPEITALYNMVPPGEQPAQFAFHIQGYNLAVNPVVEADGDYAIKLKTTDLPEAIQPLRASLQVWGTPADPSHDDQRCDKPKFARPGIACEVPTPSTAPEKAFFANPTACAEPIDTKVHMTLWTDPAPTEDFTDPRWRNFVAPSPDVTECENVPFDPTLTLQPTTKRADSPSGLDVHLHIPRGDDGDPDKLVQSHLKKATATLPEGVGFNSGIADGLAACSPQQIGLTSAPGQGPIRFDNVEPSCPAASKIGSGEVISPLLEDPLRGEVFLAAQKANPFNSNFAIYVVVREPSILVKLAGKVEPDPVTGQIKVTFDENPQLPFEDFIMHFYDGPRAALATPVTCGTYVSKSDLVPWSAADPDNPTAAEIETINDPFTVDSSPSGGCATSKAQLPFDIGLRAGSADPIAGARSPLSFQVTRPDANQELERLEISPPLGFTASLKGVPYCAEAQIASAIARDSGKSEQQSPSCPVASQVGTTNVGAGAGSAPFYAPGKVYLSGPYKGEKLSVVVITPAVAGPFDLGNVVVRSVLKLDPLTAQITAVTDSLPKTIEGVPLRIKDIRVDLDRPQWGINPTSCEEKQVKVTAIGTEGAVSTPTNRYQLDGCNGLAFKPKLSIQFKGGTKRGDHPALIAKLTTRPGDANISRAAVTLPRSAFLDQAHIRTICTRVQFAAEACPAAATYGHASVITPLLDDPLQGNVILRSSNNKLPDLVGDLKGTADIEAVGRIDSIKGGIRNTFEVVPDAPFDSFTLQMQGGKKGLVINSQNLCAKTHRATVKLTAHNGRTYNFRPKVVATGCGKANRKGQKKRGAGRGD